MDTSDNSPSSEQNEQLDELLEKAEQQLDEAGKINATHAFNLGCMIGLIPAGIIIIIALIVTRSWLAAVLITILMVVALIGLANLLALIARTNAIERTYNQEVGPAIKHDLQEANITETAFNEYAWQHVPPTSSLYGFLPKPPMETPPVKKRWIKLPFFKSK